MALTFAVAEPRRLTALFGMSSRSSDCISMKVALLPFSLKLVFSEINSTSDMHCKDEGWRSPEQQSPGDVLLAPG